MLALYLSVTRHENPGAVARCGSCLVFFLCKIIVRFWTFMHVAGIAQGFAEQEYRWHMLLL